MRTFLSLAAIVVATAAAAKHASPAVIEPVVYQGARIVVPNDDGTRGYIEAYGEATGRKLWDLTIYRVWIWPFSFMETDIQWIFIRSMVLEGNSLAITDEHGRVFCVDLETRTVERVEIAAEAASNKPVQPTRACGPRG
ncbi:hypothetical protein KF840_19900 [bacterium]|nr:hypothetical protein [bacterium]